MSDWKNVQYKDGKMRTGEGGGGGGSSNFADLDDVSFDNIQNGQVPKYNSTTQKWENANEAGGTVTDVKVNGVSVLSNGEALITSYKEVTQAQYDALPNTKLSDGIAYFIKDSGGGGGGSSGHEYSETEHITGDKWIDGSDIYEKTIALTSLSSNTTNNIAHNISNLGTLIDAFGYMKLASGEQRPIPMNYWDANWSICIFECKATTIGVWLGGSYGGNVAFSSGWLTLRYTKTS